MLLIRISNPDRKNALDVKAYDAMTECLEQAELNPEIKSVVITGAQNFFCSGHDLEDFIRNPIEDEHHPVFRFMQTLAGFSKPVVAAVEGFAVGIGSTMLLHCDLVYAGKSSFFKMPFTHLGICPEFAATFIIPQCAGHRFAAEALLLGRRISAERFAAAGFINELTDDGKALDAAMEAATDMAGLQVEAMIKTKQLIKRHFTATINSSMKEELVCLVELLKTRNESLMRE